VSWHQRATRAGEPAGILAAVGKGHGRLVYFVPSSHALEFNQMPKEKFLGFLPLPSNPRLIHSDWVYTLKLEQVPMLLEGISLKAAPT
jgi:hypothetical protein